MFDVGSWSVPATMPAIDHAGEMIVPADFAGAIRGGAASIGGGGGFNITFATNMLDGEKPAIRQQPHGHAQFGRRNNAWPSQKPFIQRLIPLPLGARNTMGDVFISRS